MPTLEEVEDIVHKCLSRTEWRRSYLVSRMVYERCETATLALMHTALEKGEVEGWVESRPIEIPRLGSKKKFKSREYRLTSAGRRVRNEAGSGFGWLVPGIA